MKPKAFLYLLLAVVYTPLSAASFKNINSIIENSNENLDTILYLIQQEEKEHEIHSKN